MNGRLSMRLVLCGVLGWSVGSARAQEAPLPPRPDVIVTAQAGPDGDLMYGPIGEGIELLGFEGMHGGKVVTGAPFSAVAVSETKQTFADGNYIKRKTLTNLYRDSQGRVRREVTLPAIGWLATSGQPKSFVVINDPVAGTSFILHPDQKTAEKMGKRFGGMKGTMKDASKGKMGYRLQQEIASGDLKKEDLGTDTQTIPGVSAQRTRMTHTIPPGQIGNNGAITIVHETWYSNDLQMMVMSTRNDPRFGTTTYMLTNIKMTEPDASLFKVPADYTVTEGGPGRGRMHRHGFEKGAPPPPPLPPASD